MTREEMLQRACDEQIVKLTVGCDDNRWEAQIKEEDFYDTGEVLARAYGVTPVQAVVGVWEQALASTNLLMRIQRMADWATSSPAQDSYASPTSDNE